MKTPIAVKSDRIRGFGHSGRRPVKSRRLSSWRIGAGSPYKWLFSAVPAALSVPRDELVSH
jgi:hypothetical protein